MNRGLPTSHLHEKRFYLRFASQSSPRNARASLFSSNRIINKVMVSSPFSKEIISNDLLVRKSIFISSFGAVAKRDGTKEEIRIQRR